MKKLKISDDTRKEMAELKVMIEQNVRLLPQLIRCLYCKLILENNNQQKEIRNKHIWAKEGYCSMWCYEMDNPPKVKHPCAFCGLAVTPFMRMGAHGRLNSTGQYAKFCEECRSLGKHLNFNRRKWTTKKINYK